MELKPEENQKQFVVHSDENHEWLYNGRDSVSINFSQRESFKTCKTIHWRGITFHVRISAPERQTSVKYVYYSIIFNERIYYRKLSRHYAGGAGYGDKMPVIESGKYCLDLYTGLQAFNLTEKPVKFSNTLKRLISKKQLPEKIEPEQPEPKQIDSEIEDTLFRVCPFMIVNASEDIKFDFPEKRKGKLTVPTDQVTLYEKSEPGVYVNSLAYFLKNGLVVDFWKLGYDYEDEELIVVNERFVPLVYKEFKIESDNKFQLLIGILNAFKGKGCFQKYQEFLESKKIPHGFRVRHDDAIGG